MKELEKQIEALEARYVKDVERIKAKKADADAIGNLLKVRKRKYDADLKALLEKKKYLETQHDQTGDLTTAEKWIKEGRKHITTMILGGKKIHVFEKKEKKK